MRIRRLAVLGLLALSSRLVSCLAAVEPFQKLLEVQRLKMKGILREPLEKYHVFFMFFMFFHVFHVFSMCSTFFFVFSCVFGSN